MPICTCADDIIFAGHGRYEGVDTFILPDNVDLYLMAPVGAGLQDGPVSALAGYRPIDRLALQKTSGKVLDLLPMELPMIIRGGQRAPMLILENLGSNKAFVQASTAQGAINVFSVDADMTLQELLYRADVATTIDAIRTMRPNDNVRLFWAAYASRSSAQSGGLVSCNAIAVADAAACHARGLADSDPRRQAAIKASHAARDYAVRYPMDTEGAIAAASVFDVRTAHQLKAY